ncbi:MAG: hypothetical protein ABIM89_18080 [Mycobacteriales bacterium]
MTEATRYGAYGMRVTGLARPELLNADVPPDWPQLQLRYQRAFDSGDVVIDDVHASFPCGEKGSVIADRASGTVTVVAPEPIGDDELAHPLLAWAASAYARWLGREAFHAGGLLVGDGVWGVTGDRGAGKSTLLAAAAERAGIGVFADDLLVMQGTTTFAGPRCVDLRDESAEYLGIGRKLQTQGRERHRVSLPLVVAEAQLRGWILLEWADAPALVSVRPADALIRIGGQRMMQIGSAAPERMLDHIALPVKELRRPRRLGGLDQAIESLLSLA